MPSTIFPTFSSDGAVTHATIRRIAEMRKQKGKPLNMHNYTIFHDSNGK
jgi:hypothetical protein